MKYFKIPVDPKLLQVHEWPSFIPPADTTYPRAYLIADGSVKVYYNLTSYQWVQATASPKVQEDEPEIKPAPNHQISADTLLRAIALAQRPELITSMNL